MPNDLIRLAMERAADGHGSQDRSFNSRRFWEAFRESAGIWDTEAEILPEVNRIIPRLVRAMLAGRSDLELLPGGGYRILP